LKDAEDLSAIIKARISEHQEMLVQQEEQKLHDQAKAEVTPEAQIAAALGVTLKNRTEIKTNQPELKADARYEFLDLWPSDMDRAENDELDRVCDKLTEAEHLISILLNNQKAA
jgi:hypothetical protein